MRRPHNHEERWHEVLCYKTALIGPGARAVKDVVPSLLEPVFAGYPSGGLQKKNFVPVERLSWCQALSRQAVNVHRQVVAKHMKRSWACICRSYIMTNADVELIIEPHMKKRMSTLEMHFAIAFSSQSTNSCRQAGLIRFRASNSNVPRGWTRTR